MHYTAYNVQCEVPTVYSLGCTVCSVQCAVCSVHCAVCSVHCAVCSVQCTVCNVQFILPTLCLESSLTTVMLCLVTQLASFPSLWSVTCDSGTVDSGQCDSGTVDSVTV